jgi:hypothetical protein
MQNRNEKTYLYAFSFQESPTFESLYTFFNSRNKYKWTTPGHFYHAENTKIFTPSYK